MKIEIENRKAKRRAKTQAWRDRTGKQKLIRGALYFNGAYLGEASRCYWKGGAA